LLAGSQPAKAQTKLHHSTPVDPAHYEHLLVGMRTPFSALGPTA
jgi:hypothetical protein